MLCGALLVPAGSLPNAYLAHAATSDEGAATISDDQLDSLVAPIALYPDPLLSQVLVASTYPLEVIEASRWVDEHISGHAGVVEVGPVFNSIPSWDLEFWNRSIKHVWTLDGTGPGPGLSLTPDLARPDGTLRYDPGTDYVLTDNGVRVIGTTIKQNGSLTLVRITHPWRLQETYYGRSPDGWIADRNDATYAYFGPARKGILAIDVSRAGFCARSAPPTHVTVRIGPVALNSQRAPRVARATSVRHVLLHSCEQKPIRLRVIAPVAATVHVAQLVRATDYGISDSRLLAAQFGGSFTPTR